MLWTEFWRKHMPKPKLSTSEIQELMKKPCEEFKPWINQLSHSPVPDLWNHCWDWIKSWGNGGGDASTEQNIKDALNVEKTDSPYHLAINIYFAVADFSKSPFEASTLTMTMMNESMLEAGEH